MNLPSIKIINKLLSMFNHFVNNLDFKTRTMIKQSFILFIVVASFIGLGIGVTLGRRAAHQGGVQIIDETNEIFDIDISRERERVLFQDLVDQPSVVESEKAEIEKAEPEEKKFQMMEKEELLEKDEAVAAPIDVFKTKETAKPLTVDEKNQPIEKGNESLPGNASDSNNSPTQAEIIIGEEDKLVTENPLPSEKPTDKPSEQEQEKKWEPAGEQTDKSENLIPLKKEEEIIE